MGDNKKPWEQDLKTETTDIAKKPWEQDFITDEKKNSVSQSGGGELASTTEKSESETLSTTKINYNPPAAKKQENILVAKSKKLDQLQSATRDQFLMNPAFTDNNPNATKNKEIYFKQLESSGYDTRPLKAFVAKLDEDKLRYADNKVRLMDNPNDLEASYNAASAATTLGKYDEAVNLYKNVLGKLNPEMTNTGHGIPVTGTTNDINAITTQSPFANPSASLYGIGYAFLGKNDYKQAADYFTQAIQADPSNANAKAGLARVQYFLGDKSGAKQTYIDAQDTAAKNEADPTLLPAKQLQELQQSDIEQQAEANRTNQVADALEAFALGDPEGKLGFVGNLNILGKWYGGIVNSSKTLGEGFKEFAKASEEGNLDNAASSLLTIGLGGAETVFAAIPEVTSFNTQVAGIKEAVKVLPKPLEETINTAVDLPFQAATATAAALGYNPDAESDAGKILQITDLVAAGVFMHMKGAATEVVKEKYAGAKGKALDQYYKILERASKPNATAEEIQQAKDVSKAASEIKIDDIKAAADEIGTPEAKEVADNISKAKEAESTGDNELHDKLANLEADQEKLSGQDKVLLQSQIDELRKQIDVQDQSAVSEHLNEATKVADISNVRGQINELEAKKEGLSEEGKQAIQSSIDKLNERLPEKPITEMNAAELSNRAEKIKSDMRSTEVEVFGEDGAKQYREAQKMVNSRSASESEMKAAQGTIKTLEAALSNEQRDRLFKGVDYETARESANRVEVIEEAEGIEDLVDAAKKPLLDYAKNPENEVSKTALNAVRKQAEKLGVSSEELIKKSLESIASELPDKADAKFLVENVLKGIAGESKIEAPETKILEGVAEQNGSTPPPVVETKVETAEPQGKTLKLAERILESDEVSPEIKNGLKRKGTSYIPISMEATEADARAYVKAFDEAGAIDKAISNVADMSNKMTGVTRGAIGKELFEVLADKAASAETLELKKEFQDKAVNVARFAAESFKNAGQTINAAKAWKRVLEKTPEGAISSLKEDYAERNAPVLDKYDVDGAKKILDDFVKSENFEKLVGEKVKAELDKMAKKAPKKENIFNSKSARDTRKEELKKKWAEAKKSSLSSSIVGLNKEQIEVLGEMAVIHLIDGAYTFKKWANKMKKDFSELTEDQLQDVWEKVKIPKEFDEQGRTIYEFSKGGIFEKMPEEVKKEFLDKWDKKLSNLKPENRKKLLAKSISEIEKLGGLEDSRFKDILSKELGLPTIDARGERHIRSLINTINKVEKSGRELQSLFDKEDGYATSFKAEIKTKTKEWLRDVEEGKRANGELSQYFKDEKRLGTTLSTLLQGNLLGTLSVAKNIYSNTLIQPLRMLSRGTASIADYTMSKAAKLPLMNKMINEGRTIDALAYWKGETKGVLPGIKTSFKELLRGINPEEMMERDLNQQLEPLKSAVRFYEGLTGKQKQTTYQQLNNFTEATFGIPAETMFRLLNLGDKPFRKAAEYGAAYEIGKLKGFEGKELDKFVLFPDSKSAEVIKQRAERAVYQQSEGLGKVAQQSIKGWETYLSEIPYAGDVAKLVFKSQIPYVKTPLNIIGETLEYALPLYSASKAVFYAVKGDRRQSLEYFGKAVTGFAIRAAVNQLTSNNLVTGNADYKDPEATAIQNQNIPPNSINITGLQRMLTGGSSAIKDNDVWINYNNMGVVGMMINIGANKKDLTPDQRGIFQDMLTDVPYLTKASLEQSFLQGVNTFLEAVQGNDLMKRKWAINTLGALASAFYPNTLANISKASDPNIRVTKADSFGEELANTFKTKFFSGGDLPTKVNLWGEPVKSAPEGRNRYVWYLLDVTKAKSVDTDSYNYKIYDLWIQAEDPKQKRDVLPNIPQQTVTFSKNNKVKLNPKLYEEYQQLVGKNRANLVQKYTLSPNWVKDDIETKIEKLTKIYKTGTETGKRQMLRAHPELKKKPTTIR
jgi:tetratricopeptide repeat protein